MIGKHTPCTATAGQGSPWRRIFPWFIPPGYLEALERMPPAGVCCCRVLSLVDEESVACACVVFLILHTPPLSRLRCCHALSLVLGHDGMVVCVRTRNCKWVGRYLRLLVGSVPRMYHSHVGCKTIIICIYCSARLCFVR